MCCGGAGCTPCANQAGSNPPVVALQFPVAYYLELDPVAILRQCYSEDVLLALPGTMRHRVGVACARHARRVLRLRSCTGGAYGVRVRTGAGTAVQTGACVRVRVDDRSLEKGGGSTQSRALAAMRVAARAADEASAPSRRHTPSSRDHTPVPYAAQGHAACVDQRGKYGRYPLITGPPLYCATVNVGCVAVSEW